MYHFSDFNTTQGSFRDKIQVVRIRERLKTYQYDILLVALLLLFCLLSFLPGLAGKRKTGEEGTVRITCRGRICGEYPLWENREIRIEEEGAYNLIRIEQGEVRVTDASCRDRICVHTRPIRYHGESIICLPNYLSVDIVSTEEGDYDAIAY